MTRSTHTAARLLLAKQRQMTSLMDKEMIADSVDLVFDKKDWVPLYYDLGNHVSSDCGEIDAYRAATLDGQLLWLVFSPGKDCGYHADCTDPFEAIERAKATQAHRREVRKDWDQVKRTAKDLFWGRQRFDVTVADLKASPLCVMGIEGFRKRVGLSRVNRISGRFAAILMKIEPQMGFVIHAAMQRHAQQNQTTDKAANTDFAPVFGV